MVGATSDFICCSEKCQLCQRLEEKWGNTCEMTEVRLRINKHGALAVCEPNFWFPTFDLPSVHLYVSPQLCGKESYVAGGSRCVLPPSWVSLSLFCCHLASDTCPCSRLKVARCWTDIFKMAFRSLPLALLCPLLNRRGKQVYLVSSATVKTSFARYLWALNEDLSSKWFRSPRSGRIMTRRKFDAVTAIELKVNISVSCFKL